VLCVYVFAISKLEVSSSTQKISLILRQTGATVELLATSTCFSVAYCRAWRETRGVANLNRRLRVLVAQAAFVHSRRSCCEITNGCSRIDASVSALLQLVSPEKET